MKTRKEIGFDKYTFVRFQKARRQCGCHAETVLTFRLTAMSRNQMMTQVILQGRFRKSEYDLQILEENVVSGF